MKKLYYVIWYIIAIVFGLITALLSRSFKGGEEFLFISPLVLIVVGAWLAEQYSLAVVFLVLGGVLKDLFSTGTGIGLVSLFGTIVILGLGMIKYYMTTAARWLLILEGVVLALLIYFADMVVSRGFKLSFDFFYFSNFTDIVLWIIGNGVGSFLCAMLVEMVTKVIQNKVEK